MRVLASVLLAMAVSLIAFGVLALQAGASSAEHGGGLLSGFGYIPIGLGLVVGLVAGATLVAVRVSRSRSAQ